MEVYSRDEIDEISRECVYLPFRKSTLKTIVRTQARNSLPVTLESESIADVCAGEDPPEDGNHSSSVVISSVCEGARETDDCDSVSSNNSSAADFKMSSTICISRANSSSLKGEAAGLTFKDFIQEKDSRLVQLDWINIHDLYKNSFITHNYTNLCKLNERAITQIKFECCFRKKDFATGNMADTTNATAGLLLLQI
uniref:Uncharacterized protein n=1 Tax=Glossina pallidipes TaxID=7398 RepID=A0A1B0AH63_GLOPL